MVKKYKKELKDILANQPKEQAVATVLRHSSNNFMSDGSEVNIPNDYMTDDSLNPFTAKLKPITRKRFSKEKRFLCFCPFRRLLCARTLKLIDIGGAL